MWITYWNPNIAFVTPIGDFLYSVIIFVFSRRFVPILLAFSSISNVTPFLRNSWKMKCNRYKSSQLNIVVRYNFNHRFPKNLVLLLLVFCNCPDNEVVSSYKTQCSFRLPSLWCGTEIIIICCVSQTDTMIAISYNKDIWTDLEIWTIVVRFQGLFLCENAGFSW